MQKFKLLIPNFYVLLSIWHLKTKTEKNLHLPFSGQAEVRCLNCLFL